MRLNLLVIVLLSGTIIACGAGCGGPVPPPVVEVEESPVPTAPSRQAEADQQIREALQKIAAAVRQRDGVAATRVTSARTLNVYEECRSAALGASETELEALPQFHVLNVFQLRNRLGRSRLSKMSGRDVFAWIVEQGIIKPETLRGLEIESIELRDDLALATVRKDGKLADDGKFEFLREQGEWKINLSGASMLDAMERPLAAVRKKANKSKVELAAFLLEKQSGKRVPREILKGPLPKD